MDEESLIDRIYEAGTVPELWAEVLHAFSQFGDAAGALLLSVGDRGVHWIASNGILDLSKNYFGRGYANAGQDNRTTRLLMARHAGFLTEHDVFTPEEWAADPIRDFLVANGFGWGIATGIQAPTGDSFVIHGERRFEAGPFQRDIAVRLDRLRPHLARAALMSARLAFERVKGAVAALDIVGIPAAILDDHGRAIAVNRLLEDLTPSVASPRRLRMTLANQAADALLGTTLEALRGRPALSLPQSIPIPAGEAHSPMVVHVHPIRRSAQDIFGNAATILLLTPVTMREVPSAEVIQGLFDLTPAEAKIARALANGKTVDQIATGTGTSPATIRNQVQAVFGKTGMRRQSELVGLLQGLFPTKNARPSTDDRD